MRRPRHSSEQYEDCPKVESHGQSRRHFLLPSMPRTEATIVPCLDGRVQTIFDQNGSTTAITIGMTGSAAECEVAWRGIACGFQKIWGL